MGDSRILFLGTSGDTFVTGKQLRSSGGIIFSYGDDQFHIDPGPGALTMAKMTKLNLRQNTAILLTGNSILKANDVNAVIMAMTHDGLDKYGVLVAPSNAIIDDRNDSPFLNKEYKKQLEKTISIDNTKRIGINQIDIEVIDLPKEICAYKFITPKFNLTYVPDTIYSNDLAEKLKETDILILNVREPRNSEKKSCLNSNDAEEIIKLVDPQLTILTGFGVKMLQSDALYEVREIQKNSKGQVIAAKDGMSINPISFAATVRQKNLRTY